MIIPKSTLGFEETDKGLMMRIPMPGIDKEDIRLNITGRNIEIRAVKKQEKRSSDEGYLNYSSSYSQFYRSFSVPQDADIEKVEASYHEGALIIKIPKKLIAIK